jgi:hypothetical protein
MIGLPWFKNHSYFLTARIMDNGDWKFLGVICLESKSVIEILAVEHFNDRDSIANWCGAVPVVLRIEGKGIVRKSLDENQYNEEQLLHQALPNARSEDFFIQIFQNIGSNQFHFNLSRKSNIENLLADFFQKKIVVKDLILHHEQDNFHYANSTVKGKGSFKLRWDEFMSDPDYDRMVSLSENCMSKRKVIHSTLRNDTLQLHTTEVINFKRTKRMLQIVPLSVFLLLFINLFCYNYFENKYMENKLITETYKVKLDSIDDLETQIKQKNELFGISGSTGSIPAAFYSDQVGATITESITLSALSVFPIEWDNDKKLVKKVRNDVITVKGTTTGGNELSLWIGKINSLDWIKGVEIVDFVQKSAQDEGIFELMITKK